MFSFVLNFVPLSMMQPLYNKHCYSPHAKCWSSSIWHFISIIIIFNFYSMIFNTSQAGLSLTALCDMLKIMCWNWNFILKKNKTFDSCWKTSWIPCSLFTCVLGKESVYFRSKLFSDRIKTIFLRSESLFSLVILLFS